MTKPETPAFNWDDLKKEIIKKRLYERLGKVNINIEICSDIESTWAGKFRIIKSNISKMNLK